uniref:J domain-containing protein n=1 Tax=Macrostomum lignano TaxID=282301 RepID=A0A1I8I6X0_9PLAT
ASETEIKSAYRRLALQYHPDKCLPEEQEAATKKFQEISLAYKKLTSTDDEVDRLKDKFMNPEFIWLLIDAMTRTDFSVLFFFMNHSEDVDDFYCDDEDEDYSDDSDSSFNDNPNWYEYYQYRRQYRDQNSPITRFSTLSPEEAEKQAKELIEAEEREKRRAQRKQEKRLKSHGRKDSGEGGQQLGATAATDDSKDQDACSGSSGEDSSTGDIE